MMALVNLRVVVDLPVMVIFPESVGELNCNNYLDWITMKKRLDYLGQLPVDCHQTGITREDSGCYELCGGWNGRKIVKEEKLRGKKDKGSGKNQELTKSSNST